MANDLDQIFASIEEGNKLLSEGKCWEAADKFCDVQEELNSLAAASKNVAGQTDEEATKISNLYQQQGREYFLKSRESLVKALQAEIQSDSSEPSSLLHQSLSDEQLSKRVKVYCRLFGGESAISSKSLGIDMPDASVTDQEASLADRLATLNANLPKGFKTSDERMRDIDRGLNRLGLSLYSHADTKPKIELPKSQDAQLADILAQAKDEARFQLPTTTAENDSAGSGDGSSIATPNDDDSASLDSKLELDVEDRKEILESVVEAQSHLAELIALLDVDTVEKISAQTPESLDQGRARTMLKRSRYSLQKASRLWEEAVS